MLGSIFTFFIALVVLYILGMLLVIPIKIAWRLIYNGIIGGLTLLLLNLVGGFFGLALPITPLTALLVGFLGIPGVIILLIANYL
ncbi:pro-sigmaK processing inhibitor BofA family protein [Tepidanaerobacter syntrophicus]|uniref:pro-sigmaK processing inhibitor BofA family protein n=1 Tax=Tepidanaerobacter syntrophicus TaxID=224999 RepID=UPI001BD23A74|nr:pro-sigmaK processing inhibitor BofA family protein [Tepidanaerobacter syntrophicus]